MDKDELNKFKWLDAEEHQPQNIPKQDKLQKNLIYKLLDFLEI